MDLERESVWLDLEWWNRERGEVFMDKELNEMIEATLREERITANNQPHGIIDKKEASLTSRNNLIKLNRKNER